MIQISINDREVLAALESLLAAGDDMSDAMSDIAQVLASESKRQFRAESGPGGDWPDLSETTKAMREKQGKWPGKKLQMSAGGLTASVQTGYDATSAWIGSNKPYAAMHQFGGKTSPQSMIPGKVIEARPYLPFDPVDRSLSPEAGETILEILQGYFEAALKT